jgi:WXG100 family type VII secretion target
MSQTLLTPEQVRQVANQHKQQAEQITSEQTRLRGNISTLTSVNTGAMINKLITVHEEWDSKTRQIVQNLTEMATTLNNAADRLQAQDEAGSF